MSACSLLYTVDAGLTFATFILKKKKRNILPSDRLTRCKDGTPHTPGFKRWNRLMIFFPFEITCAGNDFPTAILTIGWITTACDSVGQWKSNQQSESMPSWISLISVIKSSLSILSKDHSYSDLWYGGTYKSQSWHVFFICMWQSRVLSHNRKNELIPVKIPQNATQYNNGV